MDNKYIDVSGETLTSHKLAHFLLSLEDKILLIYCDSSGLLHKIKNIEMNSLTIDLNTD